LPGPRGLPLQFASPRKLNQIETN